MQHIGAAGKEQAQVVGQEAMIGGAVRGKIVLEPLDPIFILSAGAVEVTVQALGGGRSRDVTTKRGLSLRAVTSALRTTRKACGHVLAA